MSDEASVQTADGSESKTGKAIDTSDHLGDALNAAMDKAEGKSAAPASTDKADVDKSKTAAQSSDRPLPKGQASSEAGSADATSAVSPPEHWDAESKEAFGKLDEFARKFALGRETNFQKGIEEKALALKRWTEAVKPYQPMLMGADPVQAVERLFKAQAYLQSNPEEGLKWLASQFGLQKLFEKAAPATTEEDRYADPEVKRLKQELQATKDEQATRQRQAEQRQKQEQWAMIQQFKAETGEDGKPLRPHFDELQGEIAFYLQTGKATDLQAAYELAEKSRPEYVEAEIQRRVKESQAAEAKRKADEVSKAAEAAKGPKGKTDAKSVRGNGKWEDALEENFDKAERGGL